ncbi:MAG: 2-C-methyl-D-erythritol 2,4-cyclodiphosphate synthase [Opitutae bacterium]|nr:2-C-methyl-D-erythritol 2,4-cyclodiphosphate synthase [Opitutae bacterium]
MNKPLFRTGHGFDLHVFADDRELILGGVKIPHDRGLLGHSDADCVIHALADALLGAVALPDIGNLFPDDDPANKDMDSSIILQRAVQEIEKLGYYCSNVDLSIIAQKPKLAPYIPVMKEVLGKILKVESSCVGVKATTHERIGSLGRAEGIAVHAVCLLSRISD